MANQGIYHPTYNPNGSKKLSDGNFWYNTAISINSTMDCFDSSKMLANSGNIGTTSGRPDGIFYDQIAENSILDLRNSSKKVEDYNRLISREFNKLVAGTNRGKEGEFELIPYVSQDTDGTNSNALWANPMGSNTFNANVSVGDIITIIGINVNGIVRIYKDIVTSTATNTITLKNAVTRSNGTYYIAKKSTRTKSNTLLHCDIIGNPTNYPTAWKQSGVFGTPLIVGEDGENYIPDGTSKTYKFSKKSISKLLCIRSDDNGATWILDTGGISINSTTNSWTGVVASTRIWMVFYTTHTSMAGPTVNSEVLEIGKVWAGNYFSQISILGSTLINKIMTNSSGTAQQNKSLENYAIGISDNKIVNDSNYIPVTSTIALNNVLSPACKVFPYLTRTNGKAFLNLVFKEMKYNGTTWGDHDNTFNIVDNVSTTTDGNGQTILIGQKTVELPYFIGGDE